ncbi:MAG: (2Fe-2S)-binding protein [Bdellovibrionales bacterium]|nr:(2Fe-2S)-binding protein [Bdellovibrionales bacterium]
MPKCKINGIEVEVEKGETVIQAFMKLPQDIAHYCWHPGLSVAGVCRLCMVEIEGVPKLQIACNTEVKDGMVVNNTSDKVKEAVKWGLDFHLINHPLDCPICDQAGECGLQDQYMAFGKYDPEMAEPKVKKHKVVDLGPTIVLDTERCILCSRCVRFTSEISETHELGIFNRGDRSEIGTFESKPLDNNYSLNTVDICPVGALTSKDFRFRQRVWYLENSESICPGCSTGCNVKVYYNEEGLWRIKPRYNPEVNGYWMCDQGRDTYKYVNAPFRLQQAVVADTTSPELKSAGQTVKELHSKISDIIAKKGVGSVALVLTGQYTNEEYEDLIEAFKDDLKVTQVYHWMNMPEKKDEFDGLLLRGDRNPNTHGLLKAMKDNGIQTQWKDFEGKITKNEIEFVVVAGPENQNYFPDMNEKVALLGKVPQVVWLTSNPVKALESRKGFTALIPTKTYAEKAGTFTNYKGLKQSFKPVTLVVPGALTLSEVAQLIVGKELSLTGRPERSKELKSNHFTELRGTL